MDHSYRADLIEEFDRARGENINTSTLDGSESQTFTTSSQAPTEEPVPFFPGNENLTIEQFQQQRSRAASIHDFKVNTS